MFKLQPNPTFKARVALTVPGEAEPAELVVNFRHLSRSGLKEFFSSLGDKTDAEALAEIIDGWEEIDTPYSAQSLAALLDNYPASGLELFDAYRRELMEARRKN